MAAPKIAGIEIMKDIRKASALENPIRSAAVIVIPLLEVPGISARHWAIPIIRARPGVKEVGLLRFSWSAYHSAKPNRTVVAAIACKLRNSFSIKKRIQKPIGMIGRLAINRFSAYRPSSDGLPES